MKQLILLSSLICAFNIASWAQPPANDDCADAIPITQLDGTCSGSYDNTGATADMNPHACTGGLNLNVWFTFQAQGVSAFIDVISGIGDAEIVLVEFNPTPCDQASYASLACISGIDPTLEADNLLTVGNTYWIGVSFSNNGEGDFQICVDNPIPAANDDCDMAAPVADLNGGCTSYSNDFPSTDVLTPGCFDPNYTYNVWYSFVAQGVSLIVEIPSSPDVAQFAVIDFQGSVCNSSGAVALGCQTGTNQIVLDNALSIGQTYYIVVAFENNAVGSFDMCVDNPIPAFNDECIDAPVIPSTELDDEFNCITSINGNPLNNDYPSTDIGTFSCWNPDDSYNVWFQFVAQGPDADIIVDPTFGMHAEQIALVEFTGGPCMTSGAIVIDCSNGADLFIENTLDVGQTYFVAIGFEDNQIGDYCLNIFNPRPPPNDTACAAIALATDGSCNSGPCPGGGDCYTTINANPEFPVSSFPPSCQPAVENTVWFTISLNDPNNVGFEIDLTPITAGELSLVIGTFMDCNQTFFVEQFYCGVTFPVEFGPVDENQTYYLMVGTQDHPNDDGTFEICVNEIPPCFDNNFCEDPNGVSSANDIGLIQSQSLGNCGGGPPPEPFTCVPGCNFLADPEPGLTPCLDQNTPAVWYQFSTDGVANILNMNVTSNEFEAPSLQLFLQGAGGPCDLIGPIGLTSNNQACISGSGGEAVANSTPVSASSTYYVVVGGVNTNGGEFELCISTLEQAASCVTSSSIEVTAASLGSPLNGPFLPGEIVSICMNVNTFLVSTGVQNCQWFQGLVPVFGNGWDPSSFDGDGQPLNATMNGSSFPANNVHNGGQFDWWTDVTYHHDHCFYNVGDFDGNGSLDMCNALFDEDCTGPGLTGGCCGPCWDNTPGAILPPGWFTSGVTGLCGMDGHPTWDWGDGNTCNGPTGPWSFCFDLMVREYPDCDVDQTTKDLTVGFVTFADGEVGSWNGGPSVCGQDEPQFVKYPICCSSQIAYDDELDPICSDGTISFVLDEEEVDFWEWTVNATNVDGATPGTGNNPVTVINTLHNNSNSTGFVTYNVFGYAGGDCPAATVTITVEVYADITVDMMPFTACATPNNAYEIIPDIQGGSGNYEYNWNDGSANPTLEVPMPSQGTQYCVTVTDDAGCEGTNCVVLDVYSTFDVEVTAPVTGQCLSDGPIDLSADASGGIGGYSYEWSLPDGSSASGPNIQGEENGWYVVTATDGEGCMGRDSLMLEFWESPDVEINPAFVAICPDQEATQIFAIVVGGQMPYTYEWVTPSGANPITSFALADLVGLYYLTVTDANGCTSEIDFPVEEADVPEPNLGPDITECAVNTVEISTDQTDYLFYEWSTDQSGPSVHTIQVPGTGVYTVTVTSADYCTGTDQIVVSEYPPVEFEMPDTVTFCTGGSVTLDAGLGWQEYYWSPGGQIFNEIEVFNSGLYFIEVTDENGCTKEEEIQVIETGFLMPQLQGDTVICFTGTATLSVEDIYADYQWSDNGSIDEENIVDAPGVYYLTVTDYNGCTGLDSIEVHLGEPDPVISGGLAICDGESTSLDVGTSFAAVEWSNTLTTPSIEVTDAGTYTVTVTDQFGCTAETGVMVQVGSNPDPQIVGSTTFCTGSSTTLSADESYAGYLWSTGETSESIVVSTPGMITLEVVNAAGCIGYDTITVNEATALMPDINGDTSICNNEAITLNAGAGFESYAWSTGDTTEVITVDMPGMVDVTVTDALGCTGVDQVEVIATAPDPQITGNASFCEGESTILDAGADWVSYAWSTTETGQTINASTTDTYIVTVTDEYGCTGETAFDVTVHENPAPTITGSSQFCTGGSTTLGFASTYESYQWSTGESTSTIVVDFDGTIVATVTDINGCSGTASITIQEATSLSPQIDGDTALCTGTSIVLDAGTGYETYLWGPGGEMTSSITVSSGGTYTLTVTDANDCTGETSIAVSEYAEPFANVITEMETCNATDDGSVVDFSTLVTGGDTGGIWSDDDNSGASGVFPVLDFDGVPEGQYTFTYSTNSAVAPCEDQSYVVTLTVNDCACPSPELASPSPLCNDAGSMELTDLYIAGITEPGGTWAIVSTPAGSNPATLAGTTFDASGADPGLYTIQYTLPTPPPPGCPDSSEVQLTVNAFPDAGLAGDPAMICAEEDSTIVLSSLITDADAGGSWFESSAIPSTGGAFDDQAGTLSTATLDPGSYTFDYVVPGVAPCGDAMTTVEVIIEELPSADAGQPFELTCAENTVALGGSGTSTGPNFTYLWTSTTGTVNDPTALNPVVGKPGMYTLEVTNTLTGCKEYDEVEITASDDIPSDVIFDLNAPRCFGDPPASLEITEVDGGTPPYSYSLDSVTFGSSTVFSDIPPGSYTLYVIDDNGCATQSSFVIDPVFELQGTIEGELIIEEGNSTTLSYTFSPDMPDSLVWFVQGSVFCVGCDSITLEPVEETHVMLIMFDESLCELILEATILIRKNRNTFIPNVFSPNNDNVNDIFTVYPGSDGIIVNSMSIFTRWGELVYSRDGGFDPQLDTEGWDGTFNGKEMMPGVYVYYIEIEHPDGYIEVFKGDITLVR